MFPTILGKTISLESFLPLLKNFYYSIFFYLVGHYIYMEASFPRQINDKAVILTPKVGIKSTEICVSFWYHMFGNKIGEISAYTEFKEFRRLEHFFKIFSLKFNCIKYKH